MSAETKTAHPVATQATSDFVPNAFYYKGNKRARVRVLSWAGWWSTVLSKSGKVGKVKTRNLELFKGQRPIVVAEAACAVKAAA